MPKEARLKFKVSHLQNIPASSSNLRINNFSIYSFQHILYILGYSCLDEVQCWYLQHAIQETPEFLCASSESSLLLSALNWLPAKSLIQPSS